MKTLLALLTSLSVASLGLVGCCNSKSQQKCPVTGCSKPATSCCQKDTTSSCCKPSKTPAQQ